MASRSSQALKLHPETEAKLEELVAFYDKLPRSLTLLEELERNLMASFEDLKSAIADNSNVVKAAITLIDGFAGRLAACGTDPDKLAELISDLNRDKTALADAIAKNTTAEPDTTEGQPTVANPNPAPPVEAPVSDPLPLPDLPPPDPGDPNVQP